MANDTYPGLGRLDRIQWRVLLIDDEEDIREIVSVVLEDAGYRVETAADGVDGMGACRRFAPHIVITDIRMPRLDGLGVLKQIKSDYPEIEVIVATAFAEISLAVEALQLDASDFITKPIDDDALAEALQLSSRQVANARCRELARDGLVERRRLGGKIHNTWVGGKGASSGESPSVQV